LRESFNVNLALCSKFCKFEALIQRVCGHCASAVDTISQ